MWFAVGNYVSYWTLEVLPLFRGNYPLSSFPHLAFTALLLHVAIFWLGLAVLLWSYIGYTALVRRRAA